jgi:hypothetical protein
MWQKPFRLATKDHKELKGDAFVVSVLFCGKNRFAGLSESLATGGTGRRQGYGRLATGTKG